MDGFASYASADEVLLACYELIAPPKRQTVAEHAIDHRILINAGGGYSGRWTHTRVPYLVEPMRTLTDMRYQTIAVVGPGQSGKTTIAENWLLQAVDADPANILWYMQSDDAVEAYCKGTINPMIDAHEELKGRLGLRPVDDSLHFKRFRGMHVEFLSATLRTLINKKAPRIIADEIDAYPQGLGDVKALLDVRRQTFGKQSKLLMMSHPDMARGINPETDWTAGIMSVYADSTRCVWYWPCPHCGAWSSPVPIAPRVMTIDYPLEATLAEIEAQARLLCPVNGCLIENRLRQPMNARGVWVGAGEEIAEDGTITGERDRNTVAGYWIVGAMSSFVMGGIGGLARARVKAERECAVSGDDGTIRQVISKAWGIPYAPMRGVGSIEAAALIERAEPSLILGRVPEGVRFLTCSVDVQIAHFEYLVRGWGRNSESWIIDHGKLLAEPATSPQSWDDLFEKVLTRRYALSDGSGRLMMLRGAGFDSGGAPGVAQQAYAAWTRWRKRKVADHIGQLASGVRWFGKISGRDVYSIIPLKGAGGVNAPKLSVTYPDTVRAANLAAARGSVPVALFNSNLFKDDLMGQLARADLGDWYVHFPGALKSHEAPHVFFEQLTSEVRRGNGAWEKVRAAARNEALDLMVMAHVVAHLHGLGRIDWQRPPAWAAEWDDNPMVFIPDSAKPAATDHATASGALRAPSPTALSVDPAQASRRQALIKKLAGSSQDYE